MICSSDLISPPEEEFTLDDLTAEAVQKKVRAFVYSVARGKEGGKPRGGFVNLAFGF